MGGGKRDLMRTPKIQQSNVSNSFFSDERNEVTELSPKLILDKHEKKLRYELSLALEEKKNKKIQNEKKKNVMRQLKAE